MLIVSLLLNLKREHSQYDHLDLLPLIKPRKKFGINVSTPPSIGLIYHTATEREKKSDLVNFVSLSNNLYERLTTI